MQAKLVSLRGSNEPWHLLNRCSVWANGQEVRSHNTLKSDKNLYWQITAAFPVFSAKSPRGNKYTGLLFPPERLSSTVSCTVAVQIFNSTTLFNNKYPDVKKHIFVYINGEWHKENVGLNGGCVEIIFGSLVEIISVLTEVVLIPAWPLVHVRQSFKDGLLLKPAGRAVQSCSCFWWCLTALIDVYFGIEFHSFHANVLHAVKWVRVAIGGRSLCAPE